VGEEELLKRVKSDLLSDLACLPRDAALRRINELVKRTRAVKVHAYLIHYLRKQMPKLMAWGRREKQQELLANLEQEFADCARRFRLSLFFNFFNFFHSGSCFIFCSFS
jgi:hypothetical protein